MENGTGRDEMEEFATVTQRLKYTAFHLHGVMWQTGTGGMNMVAAASSKDMVGNLPFSPLLPAYRLPFLPPPLYTCIFMAWHVYGHAFVFCGTGWAWAWRGMVGQWLSS